MNSFKAFARDACGRALSQLRITAPGARLHQRLSIITFHRVLTEPQRRHYPLPGLAVTPDELDAHLRFATRYFRCMSLASALDLWDSDCSSDPPLLAITFDDGQVDNYNNALPVLERNGVTASFYVPSQILEDPSPLWHDAMAASVAQLTADLGDPQAFTDPFTCKGAGGLLAELHPDSGNARAVNPVSIEAALEATKLWSPARRKDWILRAQSMRPGRERHEWDGFMSVGQMKDLIARGHEIGSHSHSHALLPQCTEEELRVEIAGSKLRLESALGTSISTFCYPNGSTDRRSVAQVEMSGYRAAVTTQWGSNSRTDDRHQLRRFDMNARHAQDRRGQFSEARLAWRMSGLYPGLSSSRQTSY